MMIGETFLRQSALSSPLPLPFSVSPLVCTSRGSKYWIHDKQAITIPTLWKLQFFRTYPVFPHSPPLPPVTPTYILFPFGS